MILGLAVQEEGGRLMVNGFFLQCWTKEGDLLFPNCK